MLDLNEVRMFVQVVRARSFAEAARRLHVPPNTLSRRIRQLEASLGTRLMQRSTRKLTLTAAGQAFFERCGAAVDGVLAAGKELADGSEQPSGSVRVAAPVDFLDLFRVEWIVEFLERHPLVRLEFLLSDERADLIEESIDVALRGGYPREASSAYRHIGSHAMNLVASPGYLAARGTPLTLQDLAHHDCLITAPRQGRDLWRLHGPDGVEEIRVSGRFSANSTSALLKSCLVGLGIGMLPSVMIAAEVRGGGLVQVLPSYGRSGADFNVLVPSPEQIPAAVTVFIDFVTERLQRVMAGVTDISPRVQPRAPPSAQPGVEPMIPARARRPAEGRLRQR
jgi:DNA-binding transcriptional LysR family regulator